MIKKIMLSIILFAFATNVNAISYKGCESSEISKQKSFVSNVNISYDYYMSDGYPIFSVTLNNITQDMYFVDLNTRIEYHFESTNNGEITISGYRSGDSGRYKFYSENCGNITLGFKYYKFPDYNYYYSDPLCEGMNLNICNKWGKVNYSRSEFEEIINKYKNSDTAIDDGKGTSYEKSIIDVIVEFYIKYYFYILMSIIVFSLIIIYVKRRRDSFNLK